MKRFFQRFRNKKDDSDDDEKNDNSGNKNNANFEAQLQEKPKKKKCGCGCAELKIRSKELLWFDGMQTFVDCGLFEEDLSQAITVEACIKRTAVDPLHIKEHQINGHIVNQGGGWDEPGWSTFIYGGQFRAELQNNTQAKSILDNDAPDRDEWAHIAFTWTLTNGLMTSYINGVKCSQQKHHGAALPKPSQITQHVNIGRNEKRENYFCGFIADVRIWNRELSAQEIEKYSKCFKYAPGEHNGLVAYYPLDEGHGTVAHCLNNPKYDGSIASPLWVRNGFEPRPKIQYEEEAQFPPSPVTREWAGRKCTWKDVSINGGPNHVRCFPGTPLTISLKYHAHWNYSNSDYCPGCIVQLYYGMMDSFSEGVVEHGIHDHSGSSTKNFFAPSCPGIYYITQHISLDYHYVRMNPPNDPNSAIAVVQVIPLEWTPSQHKLFPPEIQNAIKTVLKLALRNPTTGEPRYPECPFYAVPKDVLYIIFQYLVV